MASYFKDVYTGVSTVLTGMWITFKHLFEPTITVQYPREKLEMYPRTRARLVNHIEECGYCLGCQKVCPVKIFTIKGVKASADEDLGTLPSGSKKKMHVIQFDIDMSKCLYCGLCVDACDEGSLRWEQPQEEVAFDKGTLYHEFSDFTREQREAILKKEEERKAAAATARAAEAAAKGAGGAPVAAGQVSKPVEGAAPAPVVGVEEKKEGE